VYPAREEPGRWRAVWCEDGKRQQCDAASEERLAARLEKVTERLAAGAGHEAARLGEADPPVLIARGLSIDGQVSFTQVAIASSSRSAARRCGTCGLQPSRCSR
jgi:hypothetical protein